MGKNDVFNCVLVQNQCYRNWVRLVATLSSVGFKHHLYELLIERVKSPAPLQFFYQKCQMKKFEKNKKSRFFLKKHINSRSILTWDSQYTAKLTISTGTSNKKMFSPNFKYFVEMGSLHPTCVKSQHGLLNEKQHSFQNTRLESHCWDFWWIFVL